MSEEISSTEDQIKIARHQILKLTAYLPENMMSDLAPKVLSNLKMLKNVITEETINKLMSVGDSPSEYIGTIVEDVGVFIDQELSEFEAQLEKIITEEEARITEEKRIAEEKAARIAEEKRIAEVEAARIAEETNIPKNAFVFGNDWQCYPGYSRNGSSCIKYKYPEGRSLSNPKYKMSSDDEFEYSLEDFNSTSPTYGLDVWNPEYVGFITMHYFSSQG